MIPLKYVRSLGDTYNEGMMCLTDYIDNYGQVLLLVKDAKNLTLEDQVSDFFLFCLTKSVKSLRASFELIKNSYSQDSLIVLRTVYENYLSIEYAISYPSKLRNIFHNRLGYSIGRFKNVLNQKGRIVKGKLLDTKTNEIVDHEEISVYGLSRASKFEYDKLVNDHLYQFLSEFIHPNMVSSGSYRDEEMKHYSYTALENIIQPMWISTYLIMILLQQVILNREIDPLALNKYQKVLRRNIRRLTNYCSYVISLAKTENDNIKKEAFELIKLRLKEKKNRT